MGLLGTILFLLLALPSQQPDSMILMVNQARESRGLPSLRQSALLTNSAYERACKLRNANQFFHLGWIEIIRTNGYEGKDIGENLGRWWDSDSQVMTAWMISPTHRANILSPYYKSIGIGRCGDYWVQHFGTD